jgi:hypothetical protein
MEERMRLVVPAPGDVVRFVGRLRVTAGQVLDLVPRLIALLDQVEEIVRLLRTIDDLELRVAQAVDRALSIVEQVQPLVTEFAPTMRALHPSLRRLVETTSPDEVESVVRLINDLPDLVAKIHVDVLPVLSILGTVPDDLRELLVTSTELNQIIASVPGLNRMRRRAREEQDEQDRANHQQEQLARDAPIE